MPGIPLRDRLASGLKRVRNRSVATGLAVMATALLGASLVLKLWNATLSIPFVYSGDGVLGEMLVKSVLQHGWYFTNSNLGAPFGQELYDYPVANANSLNVLLVKAIGLFTHGVGTTVNVFFLLSFPLAAIAAYAALRLLDLSRPAAFVCAVLFALLPYHFLRGETELLLSAYYAVPFGAYLVLYLLMERPLFTARGNTGGIRRFASRRTFGTLAACLLVGSASLYYASFTFALAVAAAIVVVAARRSLRPALPALAVAAAIALVVLVQFTPSIAYRLSHGSVPAVATRSPRETELFGLKITGLLLPTLDHRIAPLANLRKRWETSTPNPGESTQALGTVGVIGAIAAVLALLAAPLRASRSEEPNRRLSSAGLAILVAVLLGTTSGLATIIAYTLTAQLHAWNRISVFIAFFALFAAGVLLDALGVRWRRGSARVGFVAVLGLVLVLGALDQTGSDYAPDYRATSSEYRSDQILVGSIERRLPYGASVFQLPYMAFPEASGVPVGEGRPQGRMGDYEAGRPYLHSVELHWSYGAIRGRPADWAFHLAGAPPAVVSAAAAAAGFDGILVDRFGYPSDAAVLVRQYARLLHTSPVDSPNGRYAFLGLAGYRQRLSASLTPDELDALRGAALDPIRASWGSGFWPIERNATSTWRWTKEQEGTLVLENPTAETRTVELEASLFTGHPAIVPNVFVLLPDGTSTAVAVGPRGSRVQAQVKLWPGTNLVRFDTSAKPFKPGRGDPRSRLYLRLADVRLVDGSFPALEVRPGLRALLRIRLLRGA